MKESGRKQGAMSPCAACKLLRRRCAQDCVFAPYFPADEPQKFASVHKVFGASNVNKMLQVHFCHYAPLSLSLSLSLSLCGKTTMRKLKFHEKKLLKKVNFLDWKREGGHREAQVLQRYHVTGRDDYKKYSGLCRMVQKLVNILKQMNPNDPFRIEMTDMLLEKLYNIGVIPTRQSLALCDRLSVSSFCRRRLSTVVVRLKFAEHLKEAVTYIEQGHLRVGPETVTDPAFLVTRNMEDFVTWVDSSKIRRKVLEYNDKLDDYDAMN